MSGVQQQIRSEITAKIVEALKNGQRPWVRPWSDNPNGGWPSSIATSKPYRGINPLLLNLVMLERGYIHRWWATFNQWRKMGVNVKKRPEDMKSGEWGVRIVFWQPITKEVEDGGQMKKVSFPLMRMYTVFNLEQVDDPEGKLAKYLIDKSMVKHPDYEVAEEVVKATKADIRYGGNSAHYALPTPYEAWPKHKAGDYICCPTSAQFKVLADYYSTLFHELGHWSEVRVKWHDEKYAMNELVAEITSCFLSQTCGIPGSDNLDNHTRYLAHWLEAMAGDDRFIIRAAAQASKNCDHILHYSGRAIVEDEPKDGNVKPSGKRKSKQQAA
jgi:antirestriction protein ArdC